MDIHVLGFPGEVGGASTELWHTIRLWRSAGWSVTLTPTWSVDQIWADRCREIGCQIAPATVSSFEPAPGVPVVSFCNAQFWPILRRLRAYFKNPAVWVPCMNWLSPKEQRRYRKGMAPDRIVCQSWWQMAQFTKALDQFGLADRCRWIRGAFDAWEIPFKLPRERRDGDPLVIGRISRASPEKYHNGIWRVLNAVRDRLDRPVQARVLGWRDLLAAKVGQPPGWVERLEPGAVPVTEFLDSIDILYQSGETNENWPRVGLEAMAAGVPIVADNRAGWAEMLVHDLGELVMDDDEAIEAICHVSRWSLKRRSFRAKRGRAIVESAYGMDGLLSAWAGLLGGIV